ncbi:DUF2971 domain-containing protein [Paraburkholderia sp. CNPSo 3274]|uniref:DUF2971 domain-containing protein n=1 Tax=unclassified Paraburkholderia TaxID=2615204 RepID=UPI0020B8536D|nr:MULTISPECIES: DUF2971 domain-containing protein [unclassified Paraburkholderia]MCP3712581.1 DUF2971 domain-containing protein [Paraburkholderia sp. CNPSo 3274]MCP3718534.1 DUF2971 domain-containing protein [Paraburkholderia sp. CNPSo 3281]MCP3724700.1 DUF2971 domain-containing protein [Paraburkholderia sp. CNPSo 3272]
MKKSELFPDPCWDVRRVLNQQSRYPRLLYKYRHVSAQHLEPLLLSSTFYLSSREQFNDPFDAQCVVRVSADLQARRARLEQLKSSAKGRRAGQPAGLNMKQREALHGDMLTHGRAKIRAQRAYDLNANAYGIYSMAETPRSLLMWAHYAHNHRGVCLVFYVPADPDVFTYALPVEYGDTYPSMEWTNPDRTDALRSLLTKSTEWSYEQESRILRTHGAKTLLPFERRALTGIIFGARCSAENKETVKALVERRIRAGGTSPALFDAHLASERYAIGIFPHGKPAPQRWRGRPASRRRSRRITRPSAAAEHCSADASGAA